MPRHTRHTITHSVSALPGARRVVGENKPRPASGIPLPELSAEDWRKLARIAERGDTTLVLPGLQNLIDLGLIKLVKGGHRPTVRGLRAHLRRTEDLGLPRPAPLNPEKS